MSADQGVDTPGDTPGELADAWLRHADRLAEQGHWRDAERAVVEAIALHQLSGAALDEGRCLRLRASLQRLQGDLDGAIVSAHSALSKVRSDPAEVAATCAEIAHVALGRGDPAAALEVFDAALGLQPSAPAAWRRGRSDALRQVGRFDEAAPELEAGARAAIAAGDTKAACELSIQAATAWQHAGRYADAERVVDAAWPSAEAASDRAALAGLALLSAMASLERGDRAAAERWAGAARDHALATQAADAYVGAAVTLARIAEQSGDPLRAYATLATAWESSAQLLGAAAARATFEPLLREQRERWGEAVFAAARRRHAADRRSIAPSADAGNRPRPAR